MAIVKGKFLHGTAGDVVFKRHGKKQVVQGRSKKEQIDMTSTTFNSAFIFGRASTLASYIRSGADQVIGFNDGGMISRFTGECNQILQKASTGTDNVFDFSQDYFSRLNGFEFNQESPVKKYLFAQPVVTLSEQNITIDLPEIQIPKDLKFPPNVSSCMMAFSVTLFDLDNNLYKTQEVKSFEIELNVEAFAVPPQQLIFNSAPGVLCIIALALHYYEKTFAGKAFVNNKTLSPSAILKAAFCPGAIIPQNDWRKMTFNEKKKRKKILKAKKASEEV